MAVIGQTKPVAPTSMRTPLFIFGVALALVAFLVMFAFGIVFIGRAQPVGQVPVVVAKGDISARETITADMLALSTVPAAAVPPGTFLHINEVAGSFAVVNIHKGQAVSDNLIVGNLDEVTSAHPYLPIPAGYTAITLPTSEQQGVAGFIARGDYIDVIATISTAQFSPKNPRMVTRTVFTNVYVLRVGPESPLPQQGQSQGLASSITVVMSLCDAQYMNWLLVSATLKYALLSYYDYSKLPAKADGTCPSTSLPDLVGPAQVDARWHLMGG